MTKLKDYVNWRLTHSDVSIESEGYPLTLENCKPNKKMKEFIIYGNGSAPMIGGERLTLVQSGINLFNRQSWNAPVQTINGITFTPLDDERIHIKGKAEDTSKVVSYKNLIHTSLRTYIKPGIYRGKACKYSSYSGFTFMFGISNGTSAVNINTKASATSVVFDNAYINYVQFHLSGNALLREYDDIIELQLVSGNVDLPYEPYVEPITTEITLSDTLCNMMGDTDYLDFKNKKAVYFRDGWFTEEVVNVELPKLTAKTTIFECTRTSLHPPSNMYAKYIKR